jgi:hypothetical protein
VGAPMSVNFMVFRFEPFITPYAPAASDSTKSSCARAAQPRQLCAPAAAQSRVRHEQPPSRQRDMRSSANQQRCVHVQLRAR